MFQRVNNTPLCVLFTCLSVDGCIGCFHILAIINNAAMSIEHSTISSKYSFHFLSIYSYTQKWEIH